MKFYALLGLLAALSYAQPNKDSSESFKSSAFDLAAESAFVQLSAFSGFAHIEPSASTSIEPSVLESARPLESDGFDKFKDTQDIKSFSQSVFFSPTESIRIDPSGNASIDPSASVPMIISASTSIEPSTPVYFPGAVETVTLKASYIDPSAPHTPVSDVYSVYIYPDNRCENDVYWVCPDLPEDQCCSMPKGNIGSVKIVPTDRE